MLLKTKGHPHLIDRPLVGRVTRDSSFVGEHNFLISEDIPSILNSDLFAAFLTKRNIQSNSANKPIIHSVETFDHLYEGDLVVINPNGIINTLYRVSSNQNSILVTERCNSNCLMCSQPPKDRDDISYHYDILKRLIPLIPKDCKELGITGGEPTLMGELFFDLLKLISEELPNTEIHCLSNGRSFAWTNFANRLGSLNTDRLMLGIPVYSDSYQVHDHIVQSKDAFNQTILGLHNLAANSQRIEIRVVLHKLTIPRLTKLARYIYKNLPFVEHVAFMGLENQGYTPHNIDQLWIDPANYMVELSDSVEFLSSMGINVSIYNSQLCVVPQGLWKYCRKSISDWKNIYIEECTKCSLVQECGGLFASNELMHSKFLKAASSSVA